MTGVAPSLGEARTRPRIGVMGASACSPEVRQLAHEVGRLIAARGGIVVCGGRGGVMEAAARGARAAGGLTIGILPGDDAAEANPAIDIPIVTGLGNARNVVNVLTSQAVIAIAGSHGTLSEIALALKCGVPVIGLQTWRLEAPDGSGSPLLAAASAAEAVALAFARRRP